VSVTSLCWENNRSTLFKPLGQKHKAISFGGSAGGYVTCSWAGTAREKSAGHTPPHPPPNSRDHRRNDKVTCQVVRTKSSQLL